MEKESEGGCGASGYYPYSVIVLYVLVKERLREEYAVYPSLSESSELEIQRLCGCERSGCRPQRHRSGRLKVDAWPYFWAWAFNQLKYDCQNTAKMAVTTDRDCGWT